MLYLSWISRFASVRRALPAGHQMSSRMKKIFLLRKTVYYRAACRASYRIKRPRGEYLVACREVVYCAKTV
jgi:hypothetical protein